MAHASNIEFSPSLRTGTSPCGFSFKKSSDLCSPMDKMELKYLNLEYANSTVLARYYKIRWLFMELCSKK